MFQIKCFFESPFLLFHLDRECPELPQLELGTVTLSGREFGGKATYTCPIGYNVVGVILQMKKLKCIKQKCEYVVSVLLSLQPDYAEMVNGQDHNQFAQKTVIPINEKHSY